MIAAMPSPRTTLILLLALAAVVFAAGLRLARQEENVRVDRDREALRRFADTVQPELQRLDAPHESHLTRLARTSSPADIFETRRAADRFVGIRQISFIHPRRSKVADVDVQVSPVANERTPTPAFAAPRTGLAMPLLLLSEDRLLGSGDQASGWIDEPGKPLLFWLRRSSEEAAVVLIDLPAVASAINGWLERWNAPEFEPVKSAGGPDQLRFRGGGVLANAGAAATGRADLLLPLRSRFGAWELASWDRREALALWEKGRPDLLCLDIMMPHIDGYEVCRRVRAADAQVPVLFLSAKSEEIDVVVGLQLGADDFIGKPFGKHEFLARIRAALRRANSRNQPARKFTMHDLTVHPLELRAERGGESIDLSPREASILALLHERAGQVVDRDTLLDRCWGADYFPESRTLDMQIAKLRKRIEPDAVALTIIETVRGAGYRFRPRGA